MCQCAHSVVCLLQEGQLCLLLWSEASSESLSAENSPDRLGPWSNTLEFNSPSITQTAGPKPLHGEVWVSWLKDLLLTFSFSFSSIGDQKRPGGCSGDRFWTSVSTRTSADNEGQFWESRTSTEERREWFGFQIPFICTNKNTSSCK